ncbi:MAG: DUF2071 domain-containing protein [Bacteroidota bacterium]
MKTLLTADWTNLLTATYETDKSFLNKYLPANTELNHWNGKCFMSLVAFMFESPAILGIPAPLYRSFEEVNLRFYVRRKENNKWRNGVVFIREIAPAYVIGQTAKWLYKENFICLPLKHEFTVDNQVVHTNYYCKINNQWNYLSMESACESFEPADETIENFIRDNYFGYTKATQNKTLEFQIKHRPWKISKATKFETNLDIEAIYGKEFKKYFAAKPLSAFLMDGSNTKISWPVLL